MKRIKCNSCAGIWMIENADLEKLTVCPYCGVSIRGELEFSEYDSLEKAIYGAISKMGKTVLLNPRQLSGFMLDTAPGLKKEIRIFSKAVNDDYVGYIRDAFEESVEAAEKTINKLHHLFVEEEGLSDNWADMLCSGLYGAILYSKGIGKTRIINVEISDYTNTTNMQNRQEIIEQSTSEILTQNDLPININTYDILKHYKCSICGYITDGYDLEYSDSKECPVCSSMQWDETDESISDIEEELQATSDPIKPKATYNSNACRSYLESAEKYLSANRVNDALEQYRQAANSGYVPAYNLIAEIYYKKQNYKKAWKWYLKSSEANDSIGQYYVGHFYQEGLYVTKNVHLATVYYEKAAQQGLMQAIVAIAECYLLGIGYEKDVQKSFEYLKQAADNGYAEAQYKLGLYFQNGEGGQKDVIQAADWYQEANLQGYGEAKDRLKECISEMSISQKIKWSFIKGGGKH